MRSTSRIRVALDRDAGGWKPVLSARVKIALSCDLIVALTAVAVGLVYLFSPRVMPYHQRVLGIEWSQLDPGIQLILLGLLRGTGLAALVTGLAVAILLLIPFRRGEPWARWAIAGLALTVLVPGAWTARGLELASGAATPWQLLVAGIALVLAGFLLSGDLQPPAAETAAERRNPVLGGGS